MITVCRYLFNQLVGQQFVSFSLFADLVDGYAVDSYVADLRSVTSTTTNKHDFDTQLPFVYIRKWLSFRVVWCPHQVSGWQVHEDSRFCHW